RGEIRDQERQPHPGAEAAALEILRVHRAALCELDHEVVEWDQRGACDTVERGETRGALAPLREAAQQQIREVHEPEQQRERETWGPRPPMSPGALRPD